MNKRKERLERLRGVLGLSAACMTYEQMTQYISVGSRQRVQQLVVDAVATLPQLAERLGVTGSRHPGRRLKQGSEAEDRSEGGTGKPGTRHTSTRARHMATARELLIQHGGHYPGATEMLCLGHGALYQFMRKYPQDFEQLIQQHRAGLGKAPRRRLRRRRY